MGPRHEAPPEAGASLSSTTVGKSQSEQPVFLLDTLGVPLSEGLVSGPALAVPSDILALVFADRASGWRTLRIGVLGSAGFADVFRHAATVYAVYPSKRFLVSKVRAFIDFAAREIDAERI